MSTTYNVFTIVGGSETTTSFKTAVRLAQDHFYTGYIQSEKGIRPVYKDQVGKFGQYWEEFQIEVENDRNQ